MTRRTLAVVSAGLRQPSSTRMLADRLATATQRALAEGVGEQSVDVEVIELRDHAHDLTNNLLTGFASDTLRAAIDTVAKADGVIAVSPIFSGSYNGLFKDFFDVLEADTLADKPVLIAATAGTARHSLALEHALRPLFTYLKAVVVPTAVFAATEDWGAGGGTADRGLVDRIERAARQLADLIAARPPAVAVDPFHLEMPFEQMLDAR